LSAPTHFYKSKAMAKNATLKAEERKRTGSGVLKQMRKEGWVPSIVYGGGEDNINVKIESRRFRELLAASASDSFLVNLEIDSGKKQLAFVQDIQHDALSGAILHADFMAVNNKTEIHASIPVILEGEPEGLKEGGHLEQHTYQVDISCFPQDLPETLSASVEHLEVGETLTVGDLKFPEGVKSPLEDDVVIALCASAKVEEEPEEEIAEGEEGAGEGQLAEGEESSEKEEG
jgi:large subunit ribosomal protein L25